MIADNHYNSFNRYKPYLLLQSQQLFAVCLGLDLLSLEDVLDDPFFVDDEGGAEGAEVLAAIHGLFCPHAHLLHERVVGVRHEGEGQFVFGLELLVAGGTVYADSHDGVALAAQFTVVVADAASLRRAAAGVVLRVEVQHKFQSLKLFESDLLSALVDAQYFGRLFSNLHSLYIK